MDGRRTITIIIASFGAGWLSNIVGYLPDPAIALWTKIAIAFVWVMISVMSINLKGLFHDPDFFEILAAFFFPYIIAVALPWDISTISLVMVITGGLVLRKFVKDPEQW